MKHRASRLEEGNRRISRRPGAARGRDAGRGAGARRKYRAARRIGAAAARGDIIVQADADTIYPAGWLKHIADQFAAHPEAAAILAEERADDVGVSYTSRPNGAPASTAQRMSTMTARP